MACPKLLENTTLTLHVLRYTKITTLYTPSVSNVFPRKYSITDEPTTTVDNLVLY